ncbi:MAG TPA: hypothetical protein VMH23_16165, partial [Bacteroidota bacterium]|nr:hypothetical protein [Bacteroidota bacterium]
MSRSSLLVIFLLAGIVAASAQMRFDQSDARSISAPVSYEAVSLFSADSSRVVVNIHYRIAQNFFIFVRNESSPQTSAYVAHGELVVELLNEQKISAARRIVQLPLTRESLPKETDRSANLQGAVSLSVPPGKYTIVFSV